MRLMRVVAVVLLCIASTLPSLGQRAVFFGQNVVAAASTIFDTGRGCLVDTSSGVSAVCVLTGANATAAGNFLMCRTTFSPDAVASIVDDSGDTVTSISKQSWDASTVDFTAYYVKNTTGGNHSITFTLASQIPSRMRCNELQGPSKTNPIDPASPVENSSTCSGSPITGPSITVSAPNEFLWSEMTAADGGASFTSTSGDTPFPNFNGPTSSPLSAYDTAFYRNLTAPGTYSANATQTTGAACLVYTVAIQT